MGAAGYGATLWAGLASFGKQSCPRVMGLSMGQDLTFETRFAKIPNDNCCSDNGCNDRFQ